MVDKYMSNLLNRVTWNKLMNRMMDYSGFLRCEDKEQVHIKTNVGSRKVYCIAFFLTQEPHAIFYKKQSSATSNLLHKI